MKPLRLLLLLGLFAAGGFVVVHSMLASFALVPRVPYLDHLFLQAFFFHEVDNGREGWFAFELMHGNEHLVLFPMPLYWLDNELFAARGTFLVGYVQVVNLVCAWWIARIAQRAYGLAADTMLATFACLAATLLWSMHGSNLFWPYQAHLYTWLLAFVGGACCAVWTDRTQRPRALLATIACASIGLFSFGFGIAAFGALMVFAVARWPWRFALSISALGLVQLAFYWFRMAHERLAVGMGERTLVERFAQGGEHILYLLSHPAYKLAGVLLPQPAANGVALAATGLAIAYAGPMALLHLRRRGLADDGRSLAAILLVTALFGTVTTAISRAMLGPEGARNDRYAVMAILFWIGVTMTVLSHLRRHRERVLLAFCALLLPILIPAHLLEQRLLFLGRDYIVPGEMAVLNDVTDDVALAILHPDFANPQMLPRVARGLRDRQWAMFAGPQDEWLGQPLDDAFARAAEPVFGFVHAARPAPGGGDAMRVFGYAFDQASGAAPEWIVLVDGSDVVVGIAHRLRREIVEALGGIPPHFDDTLAADGWWVGYVHAPAQEGLRAFAVRADGSVAQLRR